MMPAVRFTSSTLDSPLEGVGTQAWLTFVSAIETQSAQTISPTGALGAYAIRPQRLVELGYATNLRRTGPNRARQICDFILPWTEKKFLGNTLAQYAVVAMSMKAYYDALRRGDLKKKEDMSLAGALAILHVGGTGALKNYPNLFEHTRAIYDKARGAF